jgi:RNA polymerase sigma-70 factor (ECF subfamily)
MHDEKALFQRLAGGDEKAFRQLFHHYNKMLQPFVFKLTRSSAAAEEVLQEVFLKLWLHREKMATLADPRAYMMRIVSNESMNYLRSLARDEKLLDSIRPLLAVETPSPELSVFYRETERQVQEAVERLPVACRRIYRMSREEMMRIPEIADTLKLSDSTVKNQLVKALKSIRLYTARLLNPKLTQNPEY